MEDKVFKKKFEYFFFTCDKMFVVGKYIFMLFFVLMAASVLCHFRIGKRGKIKNIDRHPVLDVEFSMLENELGEVTAVMCEELLQPNKLIERKSHGNRKRRLLLVYCRRKMRERPLQIYEG